MEACPYCQIEIGTDEKEIDTNTNTDASLGIFQARYCDVCQSLTGTMVSPVTGIVDTIDKKTIGIYVPRDSDHKLYAPITSIVYLIEEQEGLWSRQTKIFEVPITQTKTGSVKLHLYGLVNSLVEVKVGYSRYVTNKVQLDVDNTDVLHNSVLQAKKIGDILVGSYLNLGLPSFAQFKLMVRPGDKVVGGKTIFAQWAVRRPILLTVPHAQCWLDTGEPSSGHTCDTIAMKSALNLATHLSNPLAPSLASLTSLMPTSSSSSTSSSSLPTSRRDVIVLPGNINRTLFDLNRQESRLTMFRLWTYVLIPFVDAVYDIHSFPPDGSWAGKSRRRSKKNGKSDYTKDKGKGREKSVEESKSKSSCVYHPPILVGTSDEDEADIVILEDQCDIENHASHDLLTFLKSASGGSTVPTSLEIKVALLLGGYGFNDIMDEMQKFGKESFLIEYDEGLSEEKLNAYNTLIASWIVGRIVAIE